MLCNDLNSIEAIKLQVSLVQVLIGVDRHCDKMWSTERQSTMGKCKNCDANGSHVKLLNRCPECADKVYINELLHYATYHYATKITLRK